MSGTAAKLLFTALLLVAAVACGPVAPPAPTPPPSKAPIDYVALEAQIEQTIRTGPAKLDNVRAVLVNVAGETKIAHYRKGFTEDDYLHVFSVTKSVLSVLIGIAIADGLIAGLDQPLSELLPDHRQAMSDATAQTTLRQLMTMSGGFDDYWPTAETSGTSRRGRAQTWSICCSSARSTRRGRLSWYSNPSAHLVAAVLAAALERAVANPAQFSTTPGRSSSIRWISPPATHSPGPSGFLARVRQSRIWLGNRSRRHPDRWDRSPAEGAGPAEDRRALPARRSLARSADRAR